MKGSLPLLLLFPSHRLTSSRHHGMLRLRKVLRHFPAATSLGGGVLGVVPACLWRISRGFWRRLSTRLNTALVGGGGGSIANQQLNCQQRATRCILHSPECFANIWAEYLLWGTHPAMNRLEWGIFVSPINRPMRFAEYPSAPGESRYLGRLLGFDVPPACVTLCEPS